MAITENRALRDKRNALVDELIKLNEQYSTLREDVLSGDQQRAAAALGPLESLATQLAALSLEVRNVQVANSTGNNFDPKLARSLEELINNVIDTQNGTSVATSLANKAVRIGAAQNNTQSAGQEVAQSGDAGVTNPAQPTQTFTSPDAATTIATQPDPVVAVSNSNTPAIGTSPSPSPDANAATTQTNAEEAVGQQVQPETFTDANRQGTDRATKQSYVFYATEITSEFRQGRFEQTLEGCLYIFPRPKTSQVADPPVRAADLGSQSFGLTPNNNTPRVNTNTRKVSSAQDVRKATIASQTFPLKGVGASPTNTRVTAPDNTPDSRFFGF
jgi:hypothetical protein